MSEVRGIGFILCIFYSCICLPYASKQVVLSPNKLRLQKLRLYLDWYPSIEFAGILVANEKGWYKDNGIQLKFGFRNLAIIHHVLNGEYDVGMHSGHALIRAIGKGAKIKAFAAHYQFNPLNIMYKPHDGIHKIHDLKGRRIGYFSNEEQDELRVMLGKAGLSLHDVKLVHLPSYNVFDLIKYMKAGDIDAFISWAFNYPVTFALNKFPTRQFTSNKSGFYFYGIVYFAKTSFIKSHIRLLAKFLKVTRDGWIEVYKHPKRYTSMVVNKWYPKDHYLMGNKRLTIKQQLIELKISKRYIVQGVGFKNYGSMTRFQWRAGLGIARKYGFLPKSSHLTVHDIYTDVVLNELKKLK